MRWGWGRGALEGPGGGGAPQRGVPALPIRVSSGLSLWGGLLLACSLEVTPDPCSWKPLPSSRQNWDLGPPPGATRWTLGLSPGSGGAPARPGVPVPTHPGRAPGRGIAAVTRGPASPWGPQAGGCGPGPGLWVGAQAGRALAYSARVGPVAMDTNDHRPPVGSSLGRGVQVGGRETLDLGRWG